MSFRSSIVYTVIRFVLTSANFGTFTVVSVSETLVEDKMRIRSRVILPFLVPIVPFTLTTVQVPNLALTDTKRITVWSGLSQSLGTAKGLRVCKLRNLTNRPSRGQVFQTGQGA